MANGDWRRFAKKTLKDFWEREPAAKASLELVPSFGSKSKVSEVLSGQRPASRSSG
jgi:antitoxin component HigA of HigAB toxin-antitoxin module